MLIPPDHGGKPPHFNRSSRWYSLSCSLYLQWQVNWEWEGRNAKGKASSKSAHLKCAGEGPTWESTIGKVRMCGSEDVAKPHLLFRFPFHKLEAQQLVVRDTDRGSYMPWSSNPVRSGLGFFSISFHVIWGKTRTLKVSSRKRSAIPAAQWQRLFLKPKRWIMSSAFSSPTRKAFSERPPWRLRRRMVTCTRQDYFKYTISCSETIQRLRSLGSRSRHIQS